MNTFKEHRTSLLNHIYLSKHDNNKKEILTFYL